MTHNIRRVMVLIALLVPVRGMAQTVRESSQDEYSRYELLAPETSSFVAMHEVSVTTPGATDWFSPIPKGTVSSLEAVTDMMTGQPLTFERTNGPDGRTGLRIHLARPIARDGGQARVRIVATYKDPRGYMRSKDGTGDMIVFNRELAVRRNAVVLPLGYRVAGCNVPSQVLTLPDGRTQLSFMHEPSTGVIALQVTARLGAQTGEGAKPRPLTNARSWEPPPTQGPTERARLTERAHQDRDIVYFLQAPETHAFSLYHDYTESREGTDKYLNVVRTGSSVSNPSGKILDTGEAMKVDVLTGAQMKSAGIDGGAEQIAADQQVVVFRFPAVKPGQSVRLRLSETYTAPQSYRVDGGDLVFERSFGRPRNSVVLPNGWYVTALSIPGVIRSTPTGETRIDFVNDRPDSIDVLIKARKLAVGDQITPAPAQVAPPQAAAPQGAQSQGEALQGVPPVADQATFAPFATRVDSYVAKPRVVVLTDIANEPDDQMSFVRLLVSSNQFDIEALVATTSRHLRNGARPDVLHTVIDAYAKVQPNLATHEPGFPTAEALHKLVVKGQDSYGMAAVGEGRMTPGAEAIVRAADSTDPRPLWITVWGGANSLAQALWHVRATRSPAETARLVEKLRVYTISDQDDAGPWLRREFPTLHYIATPGDTNDYHVATWTGIAGDEFYRNGAGADFTTVSEAWVNEHMRKKGPLGAFYPMPCCIIEGDTPSFLGLMNNGLVSYMNPTFGGWGGRYVWRQPWLETRPYWTNARGSRDTVVGTDGKSYTSDQATIWRWREALQHDFAARMDWTIADMKHVNHNPDAIVNGIEGKAPLMIDATVGTPIALDASKSRDRDGHTLRYAWFFYPEAGSGLPGAGGGGIRPAPPRVVVTNGDKPIATVTPNAPGVAHVILAVTDNGTPSLTSYRRVILTIKGSAR